MPEAARPLCASGWRRGQTWIEGATGAAKGPRRGAGFRSSPRTREGVLCTAPREGSSLSDPVRPSQDLRRQIRHAAAHRAEAEDPAGIFFQLDALAAGALDRSLDGVDQSVEVLLGHLKSGLLGLAVSAHQKT